ncbi:unnamed protein product, partial [Vitis vinifera]
MGDLPPLSQCLMLEPITLRDQKCSRLVEIRRVLGIPFGSTGEDNSFGAAHSKPPPPVATEELKRFKASVVDTINKARGRIKRLDESIDKLNKFCDALNLRKQQRNDLLPNEKSVGLNSLKVGTHIHRSSPDLVSQRLEDRTKSVVMNKRVRTSMADIRVFWTAFGEMGGSQSPCFTRPFNDWKMEEVEMLFCCLGGKKVNVGEEEDRVRWMDSKDCLFSVKSLYRALQSDSLVSFPSKIIWNSSVQPKLSFFAWEASWGKVLTLDWLQKREGRSSGPPRQTMVMAKDRDMLKDGGVGSDLVEEKIRRLPAGGEGWDKKMKRKRSVGAVFTRPMDSDGELKRAMHHKLNNETGLQAGDAQGIRSGSSNGSSGANKLDGTSLSASSNARVTQKTELEKASLSRDHTAGLNKERLVAKGSNKLNIREDNNVVTPSPIIKGKASRGPRTGPVAANSSLNFPRTSGALEGWEQSPGVNKIHSIGATNNRKRPMPTGSSSPPMAQWGGQRPQKISRTRRANLVSPVSNHDEVQISSEGCTPDFGARMASTGNSGSLLARGVGNGSQHGKMKLENVSSPARLSESEESGAGENRSKEKGMGSCEAEERSVNGIQNVGPSVLLAKKNKILIREEIGDGVRRQGRSGRGSAFSRASISPMREKFENPTTTKPLRSARPGSDKNGSKSGRPPLKKQSDRKALTRVGQTPNSGSPDFTGDSDDDREELLAAAKFTGDANYLACSGSFWKKMEPFFASVNLEDTSYLKQGLQRMEELHESLSQMSGNGKNALNDRVHEESSRSQTHASGEREKNQMNQIGSKESARSENLVDQFQDGDAAICGRLNAERRFNKVTPLYQRVLSALIIEDETEEEENGGQRNMSIQYSRDDSSAGACLNVDIDPQRRDEMESEYDSVLGLRLQNIYSPDKFSCNGTVQPNGSGISSFEFRYEQMSLEDKLLLELHSIGLNPETVPDLAEGEDEVINQEIMELEKKLYQQVGKKKMHLNKLSKAIQEGKEVEERALEQVALNRLVEMAYKKQLATRGSSGSKSGVSKVSKQLALAFMKRTLDRCRKFEETGKSCFSGPALRDVILAAPLCSNDAESIIHPEGLKCQPEPRASGSFTNRAGRNDYNNDKIERGLLDTHETLNHSSDQDFAKSGPILNRGKKKEVLLDDVGGSASLRATSTLGNNLLGGAKGKRSERERDKDDKNKAQAEDCSDIDFRKWIFGLMSPGNVPQDSFKEVKEPMDFPSLQIHELDSIEELGVGSDLGGPQDLSSWLNFDEDGLQDHDSMGLEIPMDDLSDLNMIL